MTGRMSTRGRSTSRKKEAFRSLLRWCGVRRRVQPVSRPVRAERDSPSMYLGRLVRDLALELHKLTRGRTDEHSKLRDRLATALLATLIVDAIGTALMWGLEKGKDQSNIESVWQACFWVSAQLLTVSSQMRNPVTPGGQVVDIFLELWAISVVAAVAGSFAAFLQRK